ncbi:hypothetical protein [Pseudonocardia sp. ICBG1034]|uniref:hypothetical protein n=1 Tax=Pseudonocardia sp. ICBG1034 TaxID=2844381 RepID=UPI001CCB677E|nr:hypothetical protein [Pseudonocardia sp. ICBG1034]
MRLVGWFGVRSGVSAEGLVTLIGGLPVRAWSLVFGLVVSMIVLWGFGSTGVGRVHRGAGGPARTLGEAGDAARPERVRHVLGADLADPDERLALHRACRSVLFHS